MMTSIEIDLYTGNTLDGRKASIALEELGLPYRVHDVDTKGGQHRSPEYLEISPPGQIPALVDGRRSPQVALFDSVAILLHLARSEDALWPKNEDVAATGEATSWLMYVSSLGAVAAQAHYFRRGAPETIALAIDRFEAATRRRYEVMNTRLNERAWFLNEYSIVDIAAYPWVIMHGWQDIDLGEYPHLDRWREAMSERSAVMAGLRVPTWDDEL